MMLHDDGPMQVQPEFSLRILDDTYAKQNRTIAAIQVGRHATCGKRSAFLAPEPSSRLLPVCPAGVHSAPASPRPLQLQRLPLSQDVLVAYYQRRPGRLAQEGLAVLHGRHLLRALCDGRVHALPLCGAEHPQQARGCGR